MDMQPVAQYWQFNMGLNQGGKWLGAAFDWGQVTGHTWQWVNDLPSAWRNGRASDYSDPAALLLMAFETAASKEYLTKDKLFTDLQTQHSLGYIDWNFHINKPCID